MRSLNLMADLHSVDAHFPAVVFPGRPPTPHPGAHPKRGVGRTRCGEATRASAVMTDLIKGQKMDLLIILFFFPSYIFSGVLRGRSKSLFSFSPLPPPPSHLPPWALLAIAAVVGVHKHPQQQPRIPRFCSTVFWFWFYFVGVNEAGAPTRGAPYLR